MRPICMIPARLNSKRIYQKNLRLLNGKPLISYIIETAIASNCFEKIYLNSEGGIFEKIANDYGINFYKRPEYLLSDITSNDDIIYDFMNVVSCEKIIQLLPTSPFITTGDILGFVNYMNRQEFDSVTSVKDIQSECVYEDEAINFDGIKKAKSVQDLEPIKCYCHSIMGYKPSIYRKNVIKYGSGYHGGTGYCGMYELKSFSAIEINIEDDWRLSEIVGEGINNPIFEPEYYDKV